MKQLFFKLRNWLYKDSRLTIRKKADSMPDGGLNNPFTVNMLTFSPPATQTKVLSKAHEETSLSGTYGLNPWDIFNPFKTNTNIVWLMMYQQGLIKDVTAEIVHPKMGSSFAVTVNNPQVGTPYAVFYNSPMELAIPSPLVGHRVDLNENGKAFWMSEKGIRVEVQRLQDSDYKEFLVIL